MVQGPKNLAHAGPSQTQMEYKKHSLMSITCELKFNYVQISANHRPCRANNSHVPVKGPLTNATRL